MCDGNAAADDTVVVVLSDDIMMTMMKIMKTYTLVETFIYYPVTTQHNFMQE